MSTLIQTDASVGVGKVPVSTNIPGVYAPRDRILSGTLVSRDALSPVYEGDRWLVSSGASSGTLWEYVNGAWSFVAVGADAGAITSALGAAPRAPSGVGLAGCTTTVGPRGTNGPPGGPGTTVVVALYLRARPGAAQQGVWGCSNGSSRGWGLVVSGASANNKMCVYLPGAVNNTTDLDPALTVGPHKVAFTLANDGLTYGYSIDGTGASGVSISASAAAPAQSADAHFLGNWINGFYSGSLVELFHLVEIPAVATQGQLDALTAAPSDLRVAVPGTLTPDMDLCFADIPGYLSPTGWSHVCRGTGRRVLVTTGSPTMTVR